MTIALLQASVVLVALMLVGCAADDTVPPATLPTTAPAARLTDCPMAEMLRDRTGWELAPRGTYRAQQVPNQILIFVDGENPTAGYEVKIAMNPARIHPPQFTVYRKAPEGMAAQVITPFKQCVRFNNDHKRPVGQLRIFDAEGSVEVPVEMVLD